MTLTQSIRLLYQLLDETLRRAEKTREVAEGLRVEIEAVKGERAAERLSWWATNAAEALEKAATNTEEVEAFHRMILWRHEPDKVRDGEETALVCTQCNEIAPCIYLKRLFKLHRIEVGE